MSDARASAPDGATPAAQTARRMLERPGVMPLLFALTCCVMNYLMGKDINADLIAYHVYSAHALVTGQYLTDFMAAGGQSYLNPVGYLPLYFMLIADWPALLIGSVLAGWHSLNFWLIWRISMDHLFRDDPQRIALALGSTALAAVTPVFVSTVGSSFLDPALSVLLLAALYAALQAPTSSRPKGWMLLGGAAFGIACGLKLTNLAFGLPMLLALLLHRAGAGWRAGVTGIAMFAVGGMLGLALSGGWWAAYLHSTFGNPVFPFFNAVFQSPDFPAVNLGHDRFSPHGWRDVLLLPARMLLLQPGVYVEPALPDLRPLAIQLALFALVTQYIIRGAMGAPGGKLMPGSAERALVGFVLAGWLLIFGTSGNGRYGVVLLLLAGPVIVVLLHALLRSGRGAAQLAAVLCAVQLAFSVSTGVARWDAAPWTRNWMDHSLPATLAEKPALYLSLNTLQVTMLYPYFARDSAFVNLIGFEPMDPGGPGAARVRTLLDRHAGRTRMIIASDEQPGSDNFNAGRIGPVLAQTANNFLAPWQLRLKSDQCEYVQMSLHGSLARVAAGGVDGRLLGQLFVVCDVEAGPGESAAFRRERERVMAVFDRAAAQCPLLFPPPGGYPFKLGEVWMKRFAVTDTIVSVVNGRLQYSKFPSGPHAVDLGALEAWERNEQRFACRRTPRF